jgi:stalled ribosome rescue protein Dom34
MSQHYHVLVWIDHHEAKIFQLNTSEVDRTKILSSQPHLHIHHKANSRDAGHASVDTAFLQRVATIITDADAVLITGPANAKKELATYIEHAHPDLAKRISGVQPLDHPSDGELVAFARTFFKADDRMHSQSHS